MFILDLAPNRSYSIAFITGLIQNSIVNIKDAFQITKYYNINVLGLDLSMTNVAATLILTAIIAACTALAVLLSHPNSYPSALFEQYILFIKHHITDSILKDKSTQYLPFVATCFSLVAIGNTCGLTPNVVGYTTQPIVTVSLGMISILVALVQGIRAKGISPIRLFCPSQIPTPLIPILTVIEMVSFAIKPISLGMRIFLNAFVGHMILDIALHILSDASIYASPICIAVLTAYRLMELVMGILQAYIFSLLSCVYIKSMVESH